MWKRLLAASALLLPGVAPGHGTWPEVNDPVNSRNSGWDFLVDANNLVMYERGANGEITATAGTNACVLLQDSINDYLTDADTGNGNHYRVKWVGEPAIYPNHLSTFESMLDVCVIFSPSTTITSGYPVAEAAELNSDDATLHLDVSEWHPTFEALGSDSAAGGTGDATDQARESAMLVIGTLYFSGQGKGIIGNGLTIEGSPTIKMIDDLNTGHTAGIGITQTTTAFLSQNTTFVGLVIDGWRRGIANNFHPYIFCNSGDSDDMGLLWRHSWSTMLGGFTSLFCGTGAQVYGSNSGSGFLSTTINGLATADSFGLVLGERTLGGDVVYDTACPGTCTTTSGPVSDFTLMNGTIEGNSWGNVVAYSASGRPTFIDIRVEQSTGNCSGLCGHSVLFGAVSCDGSTGTGPVTAGLPAGDGAADCASGADGAATAPSGTAGINGIRWIGGQIKGGDATWDGLFIGENATGDGVIYLQTKLDGNNDNSVFAFDGDATVNLDISGAEIDDGDTIPAYPHVAPAVVPLTAASTISLERNAQCSVITNDGAAAGRVHNLPAVRSGMCIIAIVSDAFDIDLNPDDADQILRLTNAAGDAISSDAIVGSTVTLRGINDSEWVPFAEQGTWSDVD